MDDFSNDMFGGPKPKTPVEEAWHKEQERKKYDIIRVKNPTAQDFYFKYDINQRKLVPADSTLDIPRYMAERYVRHMKDHIIHSMGQKKHDDALEERRKKGFPEYKSKWEEQQETYVASSYPKTDDPKLMTDVMGELWIGTVYEFRQDVPPGVADPRSGEVDLTPAEQKIMEGFDKRRVDPGDQATSAIRHDFQPQSMIPSVPPSVTPFASSFSTLKEDLVSEVTSNE